LKVSNILYNIFLGRGGGPYTTECIFGSSFGSFFGDDGGGRTFLNKESESGFEIEGRNDGGSEELLFEGRINLFISDSGGRGGGPYTTECIFGSSFGSFFGDDGGGGPFLNKESESGFEIEERNDGGGEELLLEGRINLFISDSGGRGGGPYTAAIIFGFSFGGTFFFSLSILWIRDVFKY